MERGRIYRVNHRANFGEFSIGPAGGLVTGKENTVNTEILAKYREIRQPVFTVDRSGTPYQFQVSARYAWRTARHYVITEAAWEDAEDDGKVRLLVKPDWSSDFEDLCGNTFSHDANPNISLERLDREKAEFAEKVSQDGVWGIMGEYLCPHCSQWTPVDSCWGFVGDDWKGSGYDLDIMAETLQALAAA